MADEESEEAGLIRQTGNWFKEDRRRWVWTSIPVIALLLELMSGGVSTAIAWHVPTTSSPEWFDGEPDQFRDFVDTLARLVAPIVLFIIAVGTYAIGIAYERHKSIVTKISASPNEISNNLNTQLNELTASRDEVNAAIEESRRSLATIRNHLDRDGLQQTIRIGVFSRLLSYAPLYIARNLKFFEDERIKIEILDAEGDENVAVGLRSRTYDFGICDPVFVLEADAQSSADRLKILTPITKRLDLTVVCNGNPFQTKVREPIKILTYPAPSTTYAAARRLACQLQGLEHFGSVELEPISPDDPSLQSPSALSKRISEVDFALLWNPATSWLSDAEVPGIPQDRGGLGRLCIARNPATGSVEDCWHVAPFGEGIDQKAHSLWHPHDFDYGHQILASGLLATDQMLEERPELCQMVFRAMSRAFVRLEGADWTIEKRENELFSAIKESVAGSDYLRTETIERLVKDEDAPQPSIFPFIQGQSKYDPSIYVNHLKNLRALWSNDNQNHDRFLQMDTPEEYAQYFYHLG